MIGSYLLVIAHLGIFAINAEEFLTGKLIAKGDTKEELGLSSDGSGFPEYDIEEVQVIDRTNISAILLDIMIISVHNHDILS